MTVFLSLLFCCFKQKTAYEMLISVWSSDVCSVDRAIDVIADGAEIVAAFVDRQVLAPPLGAAFVGDGAIGLEALDPVGARAGPGFQRHLVEAAQIGRASCRGRVCQYV